ncbi:MAG: hypothetical protein JWL62_3803 [Hyphomicrobiales bacterium]|nr:hypothetical protein [Hyphomicrobiales bacterium]
MVSDASLDFLVHAPGPVRDSFLLQLDRRSDSGVTSKRLINLCTKLRGCNDVLPGTTCELLEIPYGSTYGHAATILLAGRAAETRGR